MSDRERLDDCGCCADGDDRDASVNRPGLSALQYRVGTHGTFLRRMLRGLPTETVPQGGRPLQALTTRATDDPAIALLDAFAVTLDVLTFYQERIANEGFLRTATERRSVLELARAIGYELDPGVAATAYIAFTVEKPVVVPSSAVSPEQRPFQAGPGSTAVTQATVPAGTQIRSVPGPGETSQTFETAEELEARVEWNALRPRLTQPQPLDPGTAYIWVEGIVPDIRAGGWVVFFTYDDAGTLHTTPRRVVAVTHDDARSRTRFDLAGATTFPVYTPPLRADLVFALPTVATATLNASTAGSYVVHNAWTNADLSAFVQMQQWSAVALTAHLTFLNYTQPPPPPPSFDLAAPEPGVVGFTLKSGAFGHNAPRWRGLPREQRVPSAEAPTTSALYEHDWDSDPPSIGEDSQGVAYRSSDSMGGSSDDAHFFFERVVPEVLPGGWVLLQSGANRRVVRVGEVVEASLADFALSGRATGVLVEAADGGDIEESDLDPYPVRSTTLHAGSRTLPLAALPIDAPLGADTAEQDQLTLDGLVLGLDAARPVIITGEREDLPGVIASEVLHIADVIHANGFTTLFFDTGMQHRYVRATASINANVARSTNGESVAEILGSGDAATAGQRFFLRRPPLTYVPSDEPSGAETTLEVRVDEVLWEPRTSLYGAGPDEPVYTVRHDDDGYAKVIFGDGRQGARLPTGASNVVARYRSGVGLAGEVGEGKLTVLQTKPLGIREATNPVAASGGADPESLDDARAGAPVTVRTLDRIVSLEDYADFARAFAGVGKAEATELWDGQGRIVAVTIGSASGGTVAEGDDLRRNLADAIAAARAPLEPFRVTTFQPLLFDVTAGVAVDARYIAESVLADVHAALLDAYGFTRRRFGQPVTAAEVITTIHGVEGVIAVDLDALHAVTEGASSPSLASRLIARPARWEAGDVALAELLLINPAGITLTEMSP